MKASTTALCKAHKIAPCQGDRFIHCDPPIFEAPGEVCRQPFCQGITLSPIVQQGDASTPRTLKPASHGTSGMNGTLPRCSRELHLEMSVMACSVSGRAYLMEKSTVFSTLPSTDRTAWYLPTGKPAFGLLSDASTRFSSEPISKLDSSIL